MFQANIFVVSSSATSSILPQRECTADNFSKMDHLPTILRIMQICQHYNKQMRSPFRKFCWPLKDMPTSFYVNKTSKTLQYIKDKQLKLFRRWMCFIADGSITYIMVILILNFFSFWLGHTFKLFRFVHWFQNSFCFCCRTLPFICRKNFRLQCNAMRKWPKSIKWPKIAFPGSKMAPKVSKWGF